MKTIPHHRNVFFIIVFIFLCFPCPQAALSEENHSLSGECVILLHGLARTSASMDKIASRLQHEGYTVENIDYPSREKKIEELAETAVPEGLDSCRQANARRVDFVTHSLGGILVRYYLSLHQIPELGRIVMLAPPNQGSKVVDRFSIYPGFELINGPAGYQLGTDEKSIPLQLGPADFELGIIAGDQSINPILSSAFEEPNDGKVSIGEARLAGMKDFLVVHHSHPFIMRSEDVIEQIVLFLKNGRFDH